MQTLNMVLSFCQIGFLRTPVENRYRCYSYSTEEETKEYMTGPRWYNQQIMKPELELRESET